MEWSEEGIVLVTRRHGESSVILDLFTRGRGRHLGLVRGGRSSRLRSALQPGNTVIATWRARLDEHLGTYTVEPAIQRAAMVIDHGLKLSGLSTLTAMAQLIPEREAHERLFDAFQIVLDAFDDDAVWPALLVRWEMGLLDELGFGLDLGACAATGSTEDLVYVSPKSGRAVSRGAGAAYADKLMRLPGFLRPGSGDRAGAEEIVAGFALTGFFLDRHVFAARGMRFPEARERLIAVLARAG
jgi:DNA repair protein RecO (recombination protein O)